MKKPATQIAAAILLACLAGASLCGCGTKTDVSKQEQANFKGGPPPAGYLDGMAKRKAAAEKRVPPGFKAWQAQRNAATQQRGAAPGGPAPQSTP